MAREMVIVGWDGRSQPKLRYLDEIGLSDWQRSIVSAEDRAAFEAERDASRVEIEVMVADARERRSEMFDA